MTCSNANAFTSLLLAGALLAVAPTAYARDTQTLAFQMFTDGPGMGLGGDACGLSQMPDRATIAQFADDLLARIGTRGSGERRLALMIGPLAFDHDDAQIESVVRDAFEVARSRAIAVGFHIDDSKFWGCREDLVGDPSNVERVGWDTPASTGQYLNWGQPWEIAPQMCLTSPTLREEARRRAEVMATAILHEIADGQEEHFAGVIVGWETAIGLDYATRRRTGYCALANLGFGPDAPPPDRDAALLGVVRDWIGLWTGTMRASGLSREHIYSHIAFRPRANFGELSDNDRQGAETYLEFVGYAPASAAFGEDHLPGFSTYPNEAAFREIYAELEGHPGLAWASSEGANALPAPGGGAQIPDETMETYLARMFNHGATLTTVFGWGLGPAGGGFVEAAEAPESIAAYQRFLGGESLDEEPLDNAYQPAGALPQRIARMHERIGAYARSGGDISRVEPLVRRLDGHIRAGRLQEASTLVDEILAITE